MRFVPYLFLLVAGLAVATDVDELKIETTYAPTECTLKAQKGDTLKVHYVSSKTVADKLGSNTCSRRGCCSLTVASLTQGMYILYSPP
jgi:hypothetical protein